MRRASNALRRMMENTTTTSDPPPLSYAPPPMWHRRRLFRRIVLCLVLVAMAGAGTRWGPQYYRQGRLLYWQRKCMEYRAPADQVVYDRGPGAAALLATSHEYLTLAAPSNLPAPVGREPACLTSYQQGVGTPSPGGGVLFMHTLRVPSGADRLVIVRSNFRHDTPPMFIPGFDLEVSVTELATWKSPPKDVTGAMEIDVMSSILQTPPRMRIFAGQPDPADPAHFTIRYEFNGKRFIADGHFKEWPAIGTGDPWATVGFTTRPENEPLPPQ
jgi:hypothetical protein